jgi:hypothetical protein
MFHPDNQDPINNPDTPHLDDLGERDTSTTSVSAARTINDIMADLESGDQKTVVLKDLHSPSGRKLNEHSLRGSDKYQRSGIDNVEIYRLRENGDVLGGPKDVERIDEVEEMDLLAVYDSVGAMDDAESHGPNSDANRTDFLEDSRTYGAPNVVVEVGRPIYPTGSIDRSETHPQSGDYAQLLEALGYEDTAVRHDIRNGNDFVWASQSNLE